MPRPRGYRNRRTTGGVGGVAGGMLATAPRQQRNRSPYSLRLEYRRQNPVPEPGYGYCDVCHREIKLRGDGALTAHNACPGAAPTVSHGIADGSDLCLHGNLPTQRWECCGTVSQGQSRCSCGHLKQRHSRISGSDMCLDCADSICSAGT